MLLCPPADADVEPLWRSKLDPGTWARTSDGPLLPTPLTAVREAAPRPGEYALFPWTWTVSWSTRPCCSGSTTWRAPRSWACGCSRITGARASADALRVLVQHGFRSRNPRRLSLRTLASDEPALAVYRALGFVEEGRQWEAAWVEGACDDLVLMGLLRSDRTD